MSTIEIDNGGQIEKYEYVRSDMDTYIISSDDIDLSQEGFILRQKESIDNYIEKKCKLVRKSDVIRHYDDWEVTRYTFCGRACSCAEKDGFLRITMSEVPPELMNEFTYEEFRINPDERFPSQTSHHYYTYVSYDDVRLQKTVVQKHEDYRIDACGITLDMNEAARKQIIIENRIKKTEHLSPSYASEQLASLLFGCYGYNIPDKLYSTDLDVVFDEVLPHAYESYSAGGPNAGCNFSRYLIRAIENGCSYWKIGNLDLFTSNQFWIEDGKRVYPSQDYLFLMHLQIHLKLMDRHKKQVYPYTLLNLKYVYYSLKCSDFRKYLKKHNPVYWNNEVVCDDLGDYVENAMKELIYFRQLG